MRVNDDTTHTRWRIVWRALTYTYLTNALRSLLFPTYALLFLRLSVYIQKKSSYEGYIMIRNESHRKTEYNDVFCVSCDIFHSNLMAVRDFSPVSLYCIFSFHGSAGIIKAFLITFSYDLDLKGQSNQYNSH